MLREMKVPLMVACGAMAFNTVAYAAPEIDLPKQPNIVMIVADDLGYTDLGVYGSEILTPNIDGLAERGVKFSNYHTAASCAPSRAMLLTGVDNHLAGVATIPESLPPEQADHENYQGVLNNRVATIASILNEDGYHTYMSGKWHLGKEPEMLPYNRGFERTLAMSDTGADNYEQRTYLPMYEYPHWTRDGEMVQLEEPFYSSELFVDEMIGFIDSNLEDEEPFFAYLPFMAVHIPVQAPKEYTDMYLDTYRDGWTQLRSDRHTSAIDIGLVPKESAVDYHDFIDDWDALTEEEQSFEAKRMAVYAGMVTAMDDNIGRLLDYLEDEGELDNTIFIITSDNGPEYAVLDEGTFNTMGYTHEYEDLGEKGSTNFIGPNFANAAASPLGYFKFYAGEGGVRVPLIISGAGIEQQEGFNNAFTYVTDIAPTILSMTGTEAPGERFGGREIEPMSGKDLTPLLKGTRDEIYGLEDYVGYEVAGNLALYNDGYKLLMNRGGLGDGEYYLFDIINDPGETTDLKAQDPVRFQHMLNLYERYAKDHNVLPVPDHYSQDMEIALKIVYNKLSDSIVLALMVGITIAIFGLYGWQRKKLMK